MSTHLLMAVSAALSFTIGGVFMQFSDGLSRLIPSLLVYAMFAIGASLQTLATQHSQMGITYIFVIGLEVLLAVMFGILLFKEEYSSLKIAGIFLVTVGVIFLRSGNP